MAAENTTTRDQQIAQQIAEQTNQPFSPANPQEAMVDFYGTIDGIPIPPPPPPPPPPTTPQPPPQRRAVIRLGQTNPSRNRQG